MKKIVTIFQIFLLTITIACFHTDKVHAAVSLEPVFSHQAGFYQEGFYLVITRKPNTDVYITFDSSDPNPTSQRYTEPIWIDESWIEATNDELIIAPDRLGNIPELTYPISMIRTTSLYWMSPAEDIFQATIIKAIAIDNLTGEQSDIITHTYFVHPLMDDLYDFPIISLTTDIYHLYDYEHGINIPGIHYDHQVDVKGIQQAFQDNYGSLTHVGQNRTGNYFQTGDDWEKPVYVEYFTNEGDRVIAQHAGLRLHGGLSRKYTIKSYRLYADRMYDENDTFAYPFFSDKSITEFKRLILRNGGQTYQYTLMGDALAQSIIKPLSLDMQYSSPVILFINGEYFGIRNIRDRLDQHYLAKHYGIAPNEVTILTGHAFLDEGSILDQAHYQRMYSFASTKDLSIPKNYHRMTTWMDMENFIDYMIAELYVGNVDWPQNNISYWRKSGGYHPDAPLGHDGRWRWMIQDLDASFGASWGTTSASFNSFERLTGDSWKTGKLFIQLLQNEQFKAQFVYRLELLLKTVFEEERVSTMALDMIDLYAPEMPRHIARYGYPITYETWESYANRMVDFALERPSIFHDHLLDWLNLDQQHAIDIQYDQNRGSLMINHVLDNDGMSQAMYYEGLPMTLAALPDQGYYFVGWYQGDMLLSDHETIYLSPYESMDLVAVFAQGDPWIEDIKMPIAGILAASMFTVISISTLIVIFKRHKKA